MSEIRDVIQHMNEAKPKLFPGADDAEIRNRNAEKEARTKKYQFKGVKVWRELNGDWPHIKVENVCPVCGSTELDHVETDGEYDYEIEVYNCENCKTDLSMHYAVERIYLRTEVDDLPAEGTSESINEAGKLFPGADEEELDKRRNIDRKKLEQKIAKFKEERGDVADVCPHCGEDLREVGVEQDETSYGVTARIWAGSYWDYGKYIQATNDLGESRCGGCGENVVQGEDWDNE